MQYAIMRQQNPGSNNVWTAVYETVNGELSSLVYTSETEATSKLIELEAIESNGRSYKIESYQDNPNP